jgi:chromosome segregation ATPase
MADTLQHACNRKSDINPSLFRNDANNIIAIQSTRLQKKKMEEAALLQQKQLQEATEKLRNQIEDKDKVTKERDELQREKDALGKTVEQKNGELREAQTKMETFQTQKDNDIAALKKKNEEEMKALRDQLTARENEKQALQGQVNSISSVSETRRVEIESLKQTINTGGASIDKCTFLPLYYHYATVMIVNVECQMAVDAGKGEVISPF